MPIRRDSRGFTLIELLIVIVIIGLLAAIAIPKFASSKEKAYSATMKTDLRNLVTAQEAYLYDNNVYTSSFPASVYTVTAGVIGPTITLAGTGWQATVGHGVSTKSCAIYINAPPLAPAADAGVPRCSQ